MAEWSESKDTWAQPIIRSERFDNPVTAWSFSFHNFFNFLFFTRLEGNKPSNEPLDETLPVVKDDLTQFDASLSRGVRHMWIGHATSLVQFDGVTFLTDPTFSDHCSPINLFGKSRYRPPPCTVDQLPHVDFVLISHNHYDHLDLYTVKLLNSRFGDKLTWFVPLKLKKWMNDSGCKNVVEMTWWQEEAIGAGQGVKVVCTPCQHWSQRGIFDTNKVLWSSWCVIGPKHRFYFAGDTGYCDVFKTIGERYGPFTLATIPIGSYKPRFMMSYQHVDPEEAIEIHKDIKAHNSVGIHWGTFQMGMLSATENYLEPKYKLRELVSQKGIEASKFSTVDHGVDITAAFASVPAPRKPRLYSMEVLLEGFDMADDRETTRSHYIVTPDGRYKSSWETWVKPSFASLLKFIFTHSEANIPDRRELDKTLPVVKPDISQFGQSPNYGVRHMWIGHASSLVQLDGLTFLTDPIFSNRCSPVQWFGVKRYRPPPLNVNELPKIDCVLISHNHYDHLDLQSVQDLNQRFDESLIWYVPMGLKKWMNDRGCKNVVELHWWQEHLHSPESQVKIVSTPCQHWCKRTPNDDNKVLWSSWCVLGPMHKFYFAGDTGYCQVFKEIGRKYGPFDLSTIPIGAYNPRAFLKHHHVDPSEAVDIHNDIRSKKSIGIHWGTFVLSKEFYLEPREKLREELERRGMTPTSFVTVNHGDVLVLE